MRRIRGAIPSASALKVDAARGSRMQRWLGAEHQIDHGGKRRHPGRIVQLQSAFRFGRLIADPLSRRPLHSQRPQRDRSDAVEEEHYGQDVPPKPPLRG